MQYPIFFFALLAFLTGNPTAKEQVANKPLTDSLDCKQRFPREAWNSFGANNTIPPLTDEPNEFIISVDTNCKATNFISYMERAIAQQWLKDAEHKKNNNGTHVIRILNNTTKKVYLQSQDGSIMAVMQGLKKDGQWCTIQHWSFGRCGNSYRNLGFAPGAGGALVTQLPNRGNYETKLRLKVMGTDQFYYSNEFTGKIDYCEFADSKPNYNAYLDTLKPDLSKLRPSWDFPM